MNIGFVGLGKLGLPCALAIESKGHTVFGYDIDPKISTILATRKFPHREILVQDLLPKSNIQLLSLEETVKRADIVFVAVQTPHDEEYEGVTPLPKTKTNFDYSFLKKSIKDISDILSRLDEDRTIVIISTVLPGTINNEIRPLMNSHVKLCYNPFFIAMGTTIKDFLFPEFVLLGVDDLDSAKKVKDFYATLHDRPVINMKIESAELTKVAYNTFITAKIVLANTWMEIMHKLGGNVDEVTNALQLATDRIISGKYLRAGMGDGGGCHPRDNIALSWLAEHLSLSYDIFDALMRAREEQTKWLASIIHQETLTNKMGVVLLGKAFKSETNLTVGSPAILLKTLLRLHFGIEATAYDPHIDSELTFDLSIPNIYFISTKHEEFKELIAKVAVGSIVIDPWGYIEQREGIRLIKIGRA